MEEKEMNLLEIFGAIWQRKVIVILLAAIVAVLAFVKVFYFTEPTYSSKGIAGAVNIAIDTYKEMGAVK